MVVAGLEYKMVSVSSDAGLTRFKCDYQADDLPIATSTTICIGVLKTHLC